MKPTTPEYTCHCFSFSLPRLSSQSKLIPSKVRTLYIKFMHIWQHSRCTRSHTRSSSIIIKFQHQPELDSTPPLSYQQSLSLCWCYSLASFHFGVLSFFCLLVFFVFFLSGSGKQSVGSSSVWSAVVDEKSQWGKTRAFWKYKNTAM